MTRSKEAPELRAAAANPPADIPHGVAALCDIDALMRRLASGGPEEPSLISRDYEAALQAIVSGEPGRETQAVELRQVAQWYARIQHRLDEPDRIWQLLQSALAEDPRRPVSRSAHRALQRWAPESLDRTLWLVRWPKVGVAHELWVRILDPGCGRITALASSPDGALWVAGAKAPVTRWDTRTGRRLGSLPAETRRAAAIVVLGDGHLATLDRAGQNVAVWHPKTSAKTSSLRLPCRAHWLAVAGGDRLLVVDGAGYVHVWHPLSRRKVAEFELLERRRHAFAALPGGEALAVAGSTQVRLYDLSSPGEWHATFELNEAITHLCALPDNRVASWSPDGTLCLWDGSDGRRLALAETHGLVVTAMAGLPGGGVLTGAHDGRVGLWDFARAARPRWLRAHEGRVDGIVPLSDRRFASWSGRESRIAVWDVDSFAVRRRRRRRAARGIRLIPVPHGDLLTAPPGGVARVRDARSGACKRALRTQFDAAQAMACLDGQRVAMGCADGTVRVWDLRSGKRLRVLRGHPQPVRHMVLVRDDLFATACSRELRAWRASSGECLGVQACTNPPVLAMAALGDGRVAWAEQDGAVFLWDPVHRGEPHRLTRHGARVTRLVRMPRNRLATGDHDGDVRVWDLLTLQCLARSRDDGLRVQDVVPLPDGRLACTTRSGALHLWDPSATEGAVSAAARAPRAHRLAALADGRLVSANADQRLRLWRVDPWECVGAWTHEGRVWDLTVLSDGAVAVGLSTGDVFCLDLLEPSWRRAAVIREAAACAWRPDRPHLAVAQRDGQAVVYAVHALDGGVHLERLFDTRVVCDAGESVEGLRWSPDGNALYAELRRGEELRAVPLLQGGARDAARAPLPVDTRNVHYAAKGFPTPSKPRPEWLYASDGQRRARVIDDCVVIDVHTRGAAAE